MKKFYQTHQEKQIGAKENQRWKRNHIHRHKNAQDPKILWIIMHSKVDNLEEMDKFLETYNLQDWIREKVSTDQLPVMKLNQ